MINDNTTRFKYIWFVLFYITFIFVAIIYSYQVFTNANIKQVTWQDVASYDFDLVDQTLEDGVLTNTYGISTPEQLAGMFSIDEQVQENLDKANMVYADSMTSIGSPNKVEKINNEYILLNDVDMTRRSWTSSSTFSGIFNGNYHVISNLSIKSSSYQYLGMVQTLTGTIKNLFLKDITVKNTYSSSVATYTGAVTGYCRGQIENVVVLSGSVTGSAYKGNYDRCAGGIAGNMASYNGISPNITNCKNYASITSAKFSGGIAGRINSGTVKNCYNYGSISNGTNDWPRAGGITAENYGTIQLCVNYGNVSSKTSPNGTGDIRAGGIVGYTQSNIDQCANYGNITVGTTQTITSYAGGISGYSDGCSVTNCYNMGDVIVYAKKQTQSIDSSQSEFPKTKIFDYQHGYDPGYGGNKVVDMHDILEYQRLIISTQYTIQANASGIANEALQVSDCYNTGDVSGGCAYKTYTIGNFLNAKIVQGTNNVQKTFSSASQSAFIKTLDEVYFSPIANNCNNVINCYYTGELLSTEDGFDSGLLNSIICLMPPRFNGINQNYYFKAFANTSIQVQYGFDDFVKDAGNVPDRLCQSTARLYLTYYINSNTSTGKTNFIIYVGFNENLGSQTNLNSAHANVEKLLSQSQILNLPIKSHSFKGIKATSQGYNVNSSYFQKNSKINDGYPYLKNLYW